MSLRPSKKIHQYGGRTLLVAPATEPVTAAELQTHLKTNSTALPDAEANKLIATAREYLERLTGLALIDQTWTYSLDKWPNFQDEWWDGVREGHIGSLGGPPSSIILPIYPLQSVSAVVVYSEDGTPTAVDVAATFDVDTAQKPGRLSLKRGAVWPVASRSINAVEITFVSGYGAASSDVPNPLYFAVLNLAAGLYTHRGDNCDIRQLWSASGAEQLAAAYRAGGSL